MCRKRQNLILCFFQWITAFPRDTYAVVGQEKTWMGRTFGHRNPPPVTAVRDAPSVLEGTNRWNEMEEEENTGGCIALSTEFSKRITRRRRRVPVPAEVQGTKLRNLATTSSDSPGRTKTC